MVEVPAGWFWMGWEAGQPGERPRHRLWVDPFVIGRFPVTNAEYARFLAAAGSAPPPWWTHADFADPEQPVVGVAWAEAAAYCTWGDAHPGTGRAARPPRVTEGEPNPLGLHALSGVCHEWCLDWEDPGYYAVSPERNPQGPESGTRRISRGGAWRHQDPWSPVAHRSSLPPALRYSDYGFRVVSPGVRSPGR